MKNIALTMVTLALLVGGSTHSPTFSDFQKEILSTPVCWKTSVDSNLIRFDLLSGSAQSSRVLFYVNAQGQNVSVPGGSTLKNGWCCPCEGSGSSGGATVLSDLTDVNTGTPTDGEVLAYNSSNSRYESKTNFFPFNQTQTNFSGGGGSLSLRYFGNTTPTLDSVGKSYTLTVPANVYLRSVDVVGRSGLLDGSGHFNFTISTNWFTEADELLMEPLIRSSTTLTFIDKESYNIEVLQTNPSPGNVVYQVQNLDTLSGGWVQFYRF